MGTYEDLVDVEFVKKVHNEMKELLKDEEAKYLWDIKELAGEVILDMYIDTYGGTNEHK